jgi:hypothetical protein
MSLYRLREPPGRIQQHGAACEHGSGMAAQRRNACRNAIRISSRSPPGLRLLPAVSTSLATSLSVRYSRCPSATRRDGSGFVLGRKPMAKRMRTKLREIKEQLKATRHDGIGKANGLPKSCGAGWPTMLCR